MEKKELKTNYMEDDEDHKDDVMPTVNFVRFSKAGDQFVVGTSLGL